ncbi:MAG TPA: S9 family peptidase [Thermoanaerobaculia bacterium]
MPIRSRSAFVTALATLAAVVAAALPAAGADEEQDRPSDRLTAADVLDFEQVGDPRISPDGRQVVYTRRWVDPVDDEWRSALWIVEADGSRHRFLVEGSNARWSPDGTRLLYLAEGEPRGQQVFVRWMDGAGASSQVTRVLETPRDPEWSPDGRSIAFVMLVPAEEKWEIELPAPPEEASWTGEPRVVRSLHYRQDRIGFTEPGFTHLFVVPADGGTARQLTRGDWNVGARFDGLFFGASFDWTPDGRTIVFDGLRDVAPVESYLRSHVYAVDVAGGEVRQLTRRPGYWVGPTVSPDGRRIAFVGYDASGDTYQMERLQVMAIDGGEQRLLATGLDREPRNLQWSPDGRGVWFEAEDRGTLNVHRADLEGGVEPVTEGTHVLSLASVAGDAARTAAGVRSDPDEPADVVVYSLRDGAEPRRLTAVNEDLLAGKRLGRVEEIWADSSGGARVQGWLVHPPGWDGAGELPLVLEIHGGPFAMYSVGFSFNFQALAAADHLVLYANPRGSTGYGEAFSKAIDFAYPGVDYDDLMAAVDAVVARGIVDESRLYVGGCSGGGVLTSWVIAHTDRFAAATVRCPVTNWISMAGTSDVPFFTHSFFHQPFWEDPQRWFEQSTLFHVGRVTTPTLVMTGELDERTPMPQSEEYFAALQMRGVESVLLRFQDEYHGTGSKPSNQMRTLLYMLDWYGDHRRPPAAVPAPEPLGAAGAAATPASAPTPSGGRRPAR